MPPNLHSVAIKLSSVEVIVVCNSSAAEPQKSDKIRFSVRWRCPAWMMTIRAIAINQRFISKASRSIFSEKSDLSSFQLSAVSNKNSRKNSFSLSIKYFSNPKFHFLTRKQHRIKSSAQACLRPADSFTFLIQFHNQFSRSIAKQPESGDGKIKWTLKEWFFFQSEEKKS